MNRQSRPSFRLRRLAGFAAPLLAALAMTPAAEAGTYDVDICWPGFNEGFVTTYSDFSAYGHRANGCAVVNGGAMKYDSNTGMTLSLPEEMPGLTLRRFRGEVYGDHRAGSMVNPSIDAVGGGRLWSGGNLRTEFRAAQDHWVNTRGLRFNVYCTFSDGPVDCQHPAVSAIISLERSTMTLDDPVAPDVAALGGAITGTGPKRGRVAGTLNSGDRDSGVMSTVVRLGDRVVHQHTNGVINKQWRPYPRTSPQDFSVDTAETPDGVHELTLAVGDAGGNATRFSAGGVDVDNDPPLATFRPVLSGAATAGATLATTEGQWKHRNGSTASFRWERCDAQGDLCQTIPGATGPTRTLTAPDSGSTLRSVVTVSDASGEATQTSSASDLVTGPPVNHDLPVVTGVAKEGATLTADRGAWFGYPVPALSVQWERCRLLSCVDIPGATSLSHTLTTADAEHVLRARVSAFNSHGTSAATSAPTAPIAPLPVTQPVEPVKVTPIPENGKDGQNGVDGKGGTSTAVNGAAGARGAGGSPGVAGSGSHTVQVLSPNGAGATASAALSATFAKTTKRRMAVRYGKPAAITGRLLTPSGKPIVGARVEVATLSGVVGAAWTPTASVTSNAKGDFRYLAPRGTSRTVRFTYKAHLEDANVSQTTEVVISVLTGVGLDASPKALRNGQSVKFTGRVLGAPRASRKVVEVQWRDGRKWRTIASKRIRSGRYTYLYRFSRTRRPTTYVFRARVRQEAGWAYATGHSKAVKVKVRP